MAEPTTGSRVLLVVPHDALRAEIERTLVQMGFRVEAARSVEGARSVEPVVCPVRIVDMAAEGVLDWLSEDATSRTRRGFALTLALTTGALVESGRVPCSRGRFETLRKPFSIEALEARLLAHPEALQLSRGRPIDPVLETEEPALRLLLARARRLACQDVSICLDGELGVGRRALARAIHLWSSRSAQACLELGAEPSPDAVDETLGAAPGTLVIVEPASWSEASQRRLLDHLRGEQPATRPEAVPARLISVSLEPLDSARCRGGLLVETFYRLDATRLSLPAFRDRPRDWERLFRSSARIAARELGCVSSQIDPSWLDTLVRERFPGNRLGLESRLRSWLLAAGCRPDAWTPYVPGRASEGEPVGKSEPSLNLKVIERDTIVRALVHREGNRTRASEDLGISVRTLRNKIREYDLRALR